jgi:hypothetical protein
MKFELDFAFSTFHSLSNSGGIEYSFCPGICNEVSEFHPNTLEHWNIERRKGVRVIQWDLEFRLSYIYKIYSDDSSY